MLFSIEYSKLYVRISCIIWILEVEKAIQALKQHLPTSSATALDVGSEGKEYVLREQPQNLDLYNYLAINGIKIITMDLEPSTKADIIHDVTQDVSSFGQYDLVINTHLLEHVPKESFSNVIHHLESLVKKPGGLLLVSVPHKYPYHERPIDNM